MYTLNEDYFSVPNLENCYWAGFIAADGNIEKNHRSLKVSLSIKDLEHLSKFKQSLAYTGPMYTCKRNEVTTTITLKISSFKICEDLKRHFNIVPAKSMILCPPNITDEKLVLSFISGYIDGDGCIKHKDNTIAMGLVSGSKQILNWIKLKFDAITPKELLIAKNKKNSASVLNHNKYFTYEIYGKRAKYILALLKTQDIPLLNRKWDKV